MIIARIASITRTAVLWFGLIGCEATLSFGQQPAQYRTITIHATLEAPAGTPRAGIPMTVVGRRGGEILRTDSAGKVSLTCELPGDVTKGWITLAPVVDLKTLYAERDADLARFESLVESFSFLPTYEVLLPPGVEEHSITVVGTPAIVVTGKIIYPDVENLGGRSIAFGYQPQYTQVKRTTGEFIVRGVRKGEACKLFVAAPHTELVNVISLTASQTQGNVDLGEVIIDAPPANRRRVRADFLNLEQVRSSARRPHSANKCAVFIKSDATFIFEGNLIGTRQARMPGRPGQTLPEIPPGTYFVCPGTMGLTDECTRLYELLLAGRITEIDAAFAAVGVPKLVIPDDGQTSTINITIDALAACNAVKTIP